MISRYASDDEYTYPNSSTLINLKGIKDPQKLSEFETRSSFIRSFDLPLGNYDYAHLKEIHRTLFQDVYEWAGQERNVPISKGTSTFAIPAYISSALQELFRKHPPVEACTFPLEQFAEEIGYFFSELNAIHPFREGNGRASRHFLNLLVIEAGYTLDSRVLKEGWLQASIESFQGNETIMKELLLSALTE